MKYKRLYFLVTLALVTIFIPWSAVAQLEQSQFTHQQVKLQSGAALSQTAAVNGVGEYFVASRRNGDVQVAKGTLSMGGTDGALLAKYGKDGKELWSVGFKGNVSIQRIAPTPTGGAIVGGVYAGPIFHLTTSAQTAINGVAASDVQRLFVVEVSEAGELVPGAVLLPEHVKHEIGGEPIDDCCSPFVEGLLYDANAQKVRVSFTIGNKVTFANGGMPRTFEAPLLEMAYMTAPSVVYLQMSWPSQIISGSFQTHQNLDRSLFTVFGFSTVSSFQSATDGVDGTYLARSYFGQVDEIDNLTATPVTVALSEGREKLDSTKHIVIERRGADGKNKWAKTLDIVVSHYSLKEHQHTDATLNYIAPIGDGSRFVAVGYFDGKLQFSDGSTLATTVDANKGYNVDAFVIVGNANDGSIISKAKLNLSLAGYSYSRNSAAYPLSAVLDGEDLILGLPLQGEVTINGVQHSSKDGDGKGKTYNSLIAHVSLKDLTIKSAMSLQHIGDVRIDGLVKFAVGKYGYVGSVQSSEANTTEQTKLYVNGTAISPDIANAKEGIVSIQGIASSEEIINTPRPVKVVVAHADQVRVTLQKNSDPEVEYSSKMSQPQLELKKGDKLTISVSLTGSATDFAVSPIMINGIERSEFTFDGSTLEITVNAGAYTLSKNVVVRVEPAGSATLKLKTSSWEHEFTGDAGADPKVAIACGAELTVVSVTPKDPALYRCKEVLVQGASVAVGGTYTVAQKEVEDDLVVRVVMRATDFPVTFDPAQVRNGAVKVFADGQELTFDAGKSTVKVKEGSEVRIEAQPTNGKTHHAVVTVNGKPISGGVYKVTAMDEACRLEVRFVENAVFSVEVLVKTDFTYGKVTIKPEGEPAVVFEGDPAKYPQLEVYTTQRLTITAEPNSGRKFVSLKVQGESFENGSTYVVPAAGNRLRVEATFSRSTAVEIVELATVSLRSNPVAEAFVVEGSWEGTLRFTLYNALGELVKSGKAAQQGVLRVDASRLLPGIYFLRVEDAANAVKTFRAVVR